MPEEPQFNGRLATIIRSITTSSGWKTTEELRGALRGPDTKPDILITRGDGPPIVIEVEYHPASTLESDCMKSIGRQLDPAVANAYGTVSSVIAIKADQTLHDCETGDQAELLLENGHTIEFAVYQGPSKEEAKRFPQNGFILGNVRDLVDFIRPAAQPTEVIEAASQAFEQGVSDAASLILDRTRHTNAGQQIGEKLRQPWPNYSETPPTDGNGMKQEKANQTAREQTAKMTAAMLVNALAYQQNLAGHSATVVVDGKEETRTISSLTQVKKPTGFHAHDIISEWDNILSINYWPIFHIAKQLLLLIPPASNDPLIDCMVDTANAIQEAIRQNDVAGTVFQTLIADRQTLATYYTRPESTVLAAYLAVPEDLDWSNPETLRNFAIADYACGTGGLVLAAYQRARELHRNHGGYPDEVHPHMIERKLTACDIMPAAVHLTASLLSSVSPLTRYNGSRNVLYPFGAKPILDNQGKWIVEKTKNGTPRKYQNGDLVYRMESQLGSLELLNISTTMYQTVLPLTEEIALGATSEHPMIEVEMVPLSQDLVIMNPPFTTPTNHAADHAKPDNPAFAAFGTTKDDQNAMGAKLKKLARGTIGDGYAGLGSNFAAIAHNMVKPGGNIALILPISAMLGGSREGNTLISWQKLRHLIAENYNDIIVLTIAQNEDVDSSFSADTEMAEVIIIARRLDHGEGPKKIAYFVNLAERPADKIAAMETAKSIKREIKNLHSIEFNADIRVGTTIVGAVRSERISPTAKWTTCRIANLDLAHAAKELSDGNLLLPQSQNAITIPIVPIGEIGRVGPVHRLYDSSFSRKKGANESTTWPILWNRNDSQTSMVTQPDESGTIKTGREKEAHSLWERTSHLHISAECRFNSNPTCATFTERKSAGGRAWPNLRMDSVEMEKATCAWLNSTLGMISYWIQSNRTQTGRGGTTVTAIPAIPTLDVTALSSEKIKQAADIYDDFSQLQMLPANEAFKDETRQDLDRRILTEVLDLAPESLTQLDILRQQWCREPTVSGVKGTGPV